MVVRPWGSLEAGTKPAAPVVVGAGDEIAVGLAAQILFGGHNLVLACFERSRAQVAVSTNRASGNWVYLCHSGHAVGTATEMQSENSFAAGVDCSFLFLRGCEIVTHCSSFGFASARADVV